MEMMNLKALDSLDPSLVRAPVLHVLLSRREAFDVVLIMAELLCGPCEVVLQMTVHVCL